MIPGLVPHRGSRRAKDFFALSLVLRQQGYTGHITAGGHFGAFAYREILSDFPEIDSICRHEAEATLVSLATALSTGGSLTRIPGLASRDPNGNVRMTDLPAPPDLQKLPWPDRCGAPAECLGHRIAPLPVEDVADEMAHLYHQRGIQIFVFHDDNFFLPDRTQTLRRIL